MPDRLSIEGYFPTMADGLRQVYAILDEHGLSDLKPWVVAVGVVRLKAEPKWWVRGLVPPHRVPPALRQRANSAT